jgi:hypothetical protein
MKAKLNMIAAAMAMALMTGTAMAADVDHETQFARKWRCSGDWSVRIDQDTKALTARSRSFLKDKTIVLSPMGDDEDTAIWGLGLAGDAVSCAATREVCAEAAFTADGRYTLHLRTKKGGDLRRCRPRD